MTKTVTKPATTQFSENDFIISASTKTVIPTKYKKTNKPKTSQQPSTSKPNTKSQTSSSNSETSSSQANKPTDRAPEFAYRLAVVRGLNSHGGLYF